MAKSVGSAAKSNSRLCFTLVKVTTPTAPRTPLPTKFAVAEKHIARFLRCEDYTYHRGTQNIFYECSHSDFSGRSSASQGPWSSSRRLGWSFKGKLSDTLVARDRVITTCPVPQCENEFSFDEGETRVFDYPFPCSSVAISTDQNCGHPHRTRPAKQQSYSACDLPPQPERSRDHDRNEGKEPSNWLAPFHRIWTPMHTSRKAESLIITFMPVGPMIAPSRSANA